MFLWTCLQTPKVVPYLISPAPPGLVWLDGMSRCNGKITAWPPQTMTATSQWLPVLEQIHQQ